MKNALKPRITSVESINSESSSNLDHHFKELAVAYQEYGRMAGVTITPFRSPDLPLFSQKTDTEKRAIVEALGQCVKICEITHANGHSMEDSPALVWGALKEMGLRPPSDLFSRIKPNNIVEVHSAEGTQIFRNFTFYRYCSYSIEDLYCVFWNSLFERDEKQIETLMKFVSDVFSGKITKTVPLDLPMHTVKEISSTMKYAVSLKIDWGGPLFQEKTGTPVATVVVESATFAEILDSVETKALETLSLTPPATQLS